MFQPPGKDSENTPTYKSVMDLSHSINDYNNNTEKEEDEDEYNGSSSGRSTPKLSRARTPPPVLKQQPQSQPTIFSTPDPVQKAHVQKQVKAVQKQEKEKKENEEARKKINLINMITDYYKLGVKRKVFDQSSLDDFVYKAHRMSLAELEQTMITVKRALNREKRKDALFNYLGFAVTMGEGVAVNVGMPEFKGIGKVFPRIKPEIDDELEEISIEYGDSLVPNPWIRLGGKLALFAKGYYDQMQMMAGMQPQQQQTKQNTDFENQHLSKTKEYQQQ